MAALAFGVLEIDGTCICISFRETSQALPASECVWCGRCGCSRHAFVVTAGKYWKCFSYRFPAVTFLLNEDFINGRQGRGASGWRTLDPTARDTEIISPLRVPPYFPYVCHFFGLQKEKEKNREGVIPKQFSSSGWRRNLPSVGFLFILSHMCLATTVSLFLATCSLLIKRPVET